MNSILTALAALGINDAVLADIKKKRYTVIFIGETGNDPDEEGSLAKLAGLKKLGIVDRIVIVANRLPMLERAQVAQGTMDALGVDAVVAIGESYGVPQSNYDVQFGVAYRSDRTDFPGYAKVIMQTLAEAADQSVIIVAASGMTDLAEMLKPGTKDSPAIEGLFRSKVVNVSIMGGMLVEGANETLALDAFGASQGDWAGTNNAHDWKATFVARSRLQALGITIVDVAKSSAYAAAVPRDVYDRFAATGHPVGLRLQSMQEALIQHLWYRSNLPADDKIGREGLVGVLNAAWFAKVFCGNDPKALALGGSDRIWNFVLNFQLYDQLALLASIPELRKIHFVPLTTEIMPTGALVHSIGTTKASNSRTNVINPTFTADAIIETMLAGLSQR